MFNKHILDEKYVLKGIANVTLIMLGILLAGSLFFYKERMLFSDSCYNLFLIINNHNLVIAEHRYGSFITQILPYIGSKIHLPLYLLLLLYSASFNIFYLVTATVIAFRYRNYNLTILLGLYLTLFVSDSFYWPQNELHQGITWLFLAFAVNFNQTNLPFSAKILLFTFSFFLAIWTHPLVSVAAFYLWIFFWVGKTFWPFTRIQSITYSTILFALCLAKQIQGMQSWYDGDHMALVSQFSFQLLKKLFTAPQFLSFGKACVTNYWISLLLFVSGITILVKQKKYLLTIWTLVFTIGYIIVICIAFWQLSTKKFYVENFYMLLTIISITPFVYYFISITKLKYSVILMIIIFSIRLFYIYNAHFAFTNRIEIVKNISAKMKEKKLMKIIIPVSVPEMIGKYYPEGVKWYGINEPSIVNPSIQNELIQIWGCPVESVMISELNNEKPQRTFTFLDTNQMSVFFTSARDTMIRCYDKYPILLINKMQYFSLDTSNIYTLIPYDSLMNSNYK